MSFKEFKPYPKYKDSRIEWLGDIPEHWDVAPLKRSFKIVGGSTPKSEQEAYWDGALIWITPSDLSMLSSMSINDSQRKITVEGLSSCSTTLVPPGSIVISTRAPIGSLAIAGTELCTNQGCKSLVPFEETQSKFYGYLLSISTGELNIRGKGTTFLELSGDELGAFKVGSPPREEQTAIATFLDRETSRIDTLISEKERLIFLLQEYRQALISHAVTKGLDPNVKMKNSGIEWLGEVPEHWEVESIKRIGEIFYGIGEPPEYREDGIPLIRATNVHAGKLIEEGMVFVYPNDIPSKRIVWLQEGDLIIVRSGAYTGDSARIPARYQKCIAGFDMVLRCSNTDSNFAQFAFLSKYLKNDQIDLEKMRAAQPHINAEELGSCLFVAPPLFEQSSIASFLDRETSRIDTLISEARKFIDLLKEYRSSLITAAVTGKIDVREVVPYRIGETGNRP